MLLISVLKGVVIGFVLAVPVGPVGVLCIRRTLAEGRRSAASTMLGAASADMLYGAVAAFGVTLVSDFVSANLELLRTVGGGILIALGVHTFRAPVRDKPARLTFNRHAGNLVSTFFLTLTNPLTLFAFAAVMAGAGAAEETRTTVSALFLVGGVFLGSLLWFTVLTTMSYLFRETIRTKGLEVVNRISGSLVVLAGLYAIARSLFG